MSTAAAARFFALLALLLGAAALLLHAFLPADGAAAEGEPKRAARPEALAGAPQAFASELSAAARGPEFSAAATRAFADAAGEGAPTPATASFPALYGPQQFRAVVQEGGVRLSWLPHPENPVEGVRYRLVRWVGEQAAETVAETQALEHLDRVTCEGVSYHYRLTALLEREVLGGRTAFRESPAVAAVAELPRTVEWRITAYLPEEEKLLMQAESPGRPRLGPFSVTPGEEIGPTGWYLVDYRVRETEVPVETRSPRFDALGRRVIIDGRPADRVREATSKRLLATVRLSDPCGSPWSLELLLPGELAKDGR